MVGWLAVSWRAREGCVLDWVAVICFALCWITSFVLQAQYPMNGDMSIVYIERPTHYVNAHVAGLDYVVPMSSERSCCSDSGMCLRTIHW